MRKAVKYFKFELMDLEAVKLDLETVVLIITIALGMKKQFI